MRSILEEFACGNISPEARFFARNSEYGKAMRAVSEHEEALLAGLEGDEKVLFQRYVDAQGKLNSLTAAENLIYGYKLGLIMTAEAFVGMDGLVINGEV